MFCDRVEVERKFSLAKRKCGLGLIMTKLRITTEHVVAMSILLLNLRKVLSAFLRSFFNWMFLPCTAKKSAFIHLPLNRGEVAT